MSAAVLDRPAHAAGQQQPPEQLGFLEPAPAAHRVRVALHGQLADQPRVRHSGNGTAHVVVHLRAPEGDLPVYAVIHVPADQCAQAELQALAMQPGQVVMLIGRGLALYEQHETNHLELRECTSISLVDTAQHPEALTP